MADNWDAILQEMDADKVPDDIRAKVAVNFFRQNLEPEMQADKVPVETQQKVKTNFLRTLQRAPESVPFLDISGVESTDSAQLPAPEVAKPAPVSATQVPEPSGPFMEAKKISGASRAFDLREGVKPKLGGSWTDLITSILPTAGLNVAQGIGGVVRGIEEMTPGDVLAQPHYTAGLLTSPLRSIGLPGIPDALDQTAKRVSEMLPKVSISTVEEALGMDKPLGDLIYKKATAALEDQPKFEPLTAKGEIAGILSNVAMNAPGLIASLLTRNPRYALAPMSAVSGGQQLGQIREERPGIDPGKALAAGVISGVTEWWTEKLPLDKLMDPKLGLVKRILYSAGLDVPGEEIATTIQDGILAKATTNPTMSLGDFGEAVVSTAIQSLGSSLLMAGMSEGVIKLAQKKEPQKSSTINLEGKPVDILAPPKISQPAQESADQSTDTAPKSTEGGKTNETKTAAETLLNDQPVPDFKLYHGTNADYADQDITTGKKMYGIHLTTDQNVAKTYGKVKEYTLAKDAKILDLSDGDVLWNFMLKEGILDEEDAQNIDLENYVKSGQLYQYDISSRIRLADDVARTAESMGYDVIKMIDNLGGESDNIAHVVVNKKVLQSAKAADSAISPESVLKARPIPKGEAIPEAVLNTVNTEVNANPMGFTLNVFTGKPITRGFAVAPTKLTETLIGEQPTPELINQYIQRFRSVFDEEPKATLGGWKVEDQQSSKPLGSFVLDVSFVVPTFEQATYMAELGEQDGIFNLETKEYIRTEDAVNQLKAQGKYNEQGVDSVRWMKEGVENVITNGQAYVNRKPEEESYAEKIPVQSRPSGKIPPAQRVQGAPKDFQNQTVTLTHWSNQKDLKETDPSKHGTFGAGAERESKQAHPELWLNKTYYGYGTYTAEPYVGPHRYSVQVNGNDIYDAWNDPLKLYPTDAELKKRKLVGNQAANLLYEQKIRNAGYKGFAQEKYQVVALFEKAKVKKEASGMESLKTTATPQNQTDTPEFKKWFGNSKVVDDEGNPLVVYHGTASTFESFNTRRGKFKLGAYFTSDPMAASNIRGGMPSVYPVYLKMDKPFDIRETPREDIAGLLGLDENAQRYARDNGRAGAYQTLELLDERFDIVPRLKKRGYDGIIFDGENEGPTYVAFSPTQIKSAIGNRGTFSPTDPSILADMGGYADQPAPNAQTTASPTEREAYVSQVRQAIELPELVSLVADLTGGHFPKTVRFLRGAIGRFYPKTVRIGILDTLAKEGPDTVAKTLAHEIGHLADWLPQKLMNKGNILGRLASEIGYTNSLLAEYPNAPVGILTDADRQRLRKEAKRQVKAEETPDQVIIQQVTREVPEYAKTSITPDMILDIMRGRTNEPESILRFMQEADSALKKAVVVQALKGTVAPEVAALGTVGQQIGTKTVTENVEVRIPGRYATPEEIQKRFAKLLKEEILKRKLYEKEVVIAELKNLSMQWKPFNPYMSASYTAYRWSSAELYADAMSTLFNNPALMERTAPTFTKAFFNYLEKKPTFKALYDDLQELVKNPENVLTKRREFIRNMAVKGAGIRDDARLALEKKMSFSFSKLGQEFKRYVFNKNAKVNEKVDQWMKEGKEVPDHQRIDYWTEELMYINSEVSAFTLEVEKKVVEAAKAEGISIIDLHEYMEIYRALTERAKLNNPGGISDDLALKQLDKMRRDMGDAKFQRVADYAFQFRLLYMKNVLDVVADAQFLPADLLKKMLNNPDYATFVNLEYEIGKAYGTGSGAKIYQQFGMLGEVDNVFVQTVLKGQALLRAARHHQTKMAMLETMITQGEGAASLSEYHEAVARGIQPDVIKAKRIGKFTWANPPSEDYGLIVVSPHGQAQGYYVDREIAKLWEFDPDKANMAFRMLLATKSLVAHLWIQWNPGWVAMNPLRDIMGSWKKLPQASGFLLKGYKNTFKDAMRAGWGKLPERELRMLREHTLVPERFWKTDTQYHQQELDFLGRVQDPLRYQGAVLGRMKRAVDYIVQHKLDRWMIIPPMLRFLGNLGKGLERWGKMGAEEAIRLRTEATGELVSEKEMAHLIRTRAGTPNSFASGIAARWGEIIFPFSNIAIQDIVSSVEAATEVDSNKKGLSRYKLPASYAMKTFTANVLPKIFFATLLAGWWGDDMKELAKKAGKYLRRMYTTIPVGTTESGLGVFITIPQDYFGQIVGATVDAVITGEFTGTMGALGLVAGAQPYNLNPFFGAVKDWSAYYSNKVIPVNYYYGTPIMSDRVATAGGLPAFESLLRETWNEFFGGLIYRFKADHIDDINSEMKDVLGTFPGNAIGRIIRLSDTGIREANQEVTNKQAQLEARNSLDTEAEKIAAINANPEISTEDAMAVWEKGVASGKIDPATTKPRAFIKDYTDMAAKKLGNPYVDSFSRASSSGQRAALLNQWEKDLTPGKYEAIYEMLDQNRWITKPVIRKLEDLKNAESEKK